MSHYLKEVTCHLKFTSHSFKEYALARGSLIVFTWPASSHLCLLAFPPSLTDVPSSYVSATILGAKTVSVPGSPESPSPIWATDQWALDLSLTTLLTYLKLFKSPSSFWWRRQDIDRAHVALCPGPQPSPSGCISVSLLGPLSAWTGPSQDNFVFVCGYKNNLGCHLAKNDFSSSFS